jgi:hypothetical protein
MDKAITTYEGKQEIKIGDFVHSLTEPYKCGTVTKITETGVEFKAPFTSYTCKAENLEVVEVTRRWRKGE